MAARVGFVAACCLKTNMVDDNSSDSMRSSPTLSCPTELVRFDDSVKDKITFDAITEEQRSEENGRYLSRLGEFNHIWFVESENKLLSLIFIWA